MEKSRNISYIPHAAACFGSILCLLGIYMEDLHSKTIRDGKKRQGMFLKAHLGMFKMHLVFGFIDFYSLKRGFSISKDDMCIVQPPLKSRTICCQLSHQSCFNLPGYWRKTCWARFLMVAGGIDWATPLLFCRSWERISRVLPSAARAAARCPELPRSQSVLHWLTMKQ